jgi:(+)-trans-carveol dehydrogenase
VNLTIEKADMLMNDSAFARFASDLAREERTPRNLMPRFKKPHLLDLGWIEPIDVSNALLYLASDEARFVTDISLKVNAGHTAH